MRARPGSISPRSDPERRPSESLPPPDLTAPPSSDHDAPLMGREAFDACSLEELMERYVDGDVEAFEALHTRLRGPVRGSLARWLPPEHAEDALQVTFLKLHQARIRYRRGAGVLPWVLTIARNAAVDQLRRGKRSVQRLDAELAERLPAPEPEAPEWSEVDELAVVEAVRAAVQQLPEGSREVVRLHKLEGRSMAEVASILGIREGAARTRAHRGYKSLARLLDGLRARRS